MICGLKINEYPLPAKLFTQTLKIYGQTRLLMF